MENAMADETPAFCVSNFITTNEELMAEYGKQAMPIVQKYGGRIIASDRNITQLEGEAKSGLAIIAFPSMKAAEAFYHSAEYSTVRQMRFDATDGAFFIISRGIATK
jgi:uncharacterized protein (DUF1330 family)